MNKAQHTTRYIKHLADSADFKVSTFNKHCNGLIGNRFEMPNVSYTHPLPPSVKTTQQTIYNLKKIKENAHAQNSTFANRTNRHTTNVCKRAVFFPTHPSPPTTLENSLTKNLEK